MKIKKSFLAILAVFTLFAASASTSVSAFTSVEANAATHHKDTKKHKKAKKSSKKHKKATKKSKKKATKKHKKVTKKHSKMKNTHKKAKKHQGKRSTSKSKKTHVTTPHVTKRHVRVDNAKPTISINDGSGSVNVAYSSVQDKSYDNVDLNNVTSYSTSNHNLKLRGISYYKLNGNDKFKTAITLKLQFTDYDRVDQYVASSAGTYLVNSDGQYMYASWGENHGDFTPTFATVPSNSSQFVNLTFYSSQDLSLSSFNTFNFVYDVSASNFGTTINY